jgi:hypothetical protein
MTKSKRKSRATKGRTKLGREFLIALFSAALAPGGVAACNIATATTPSDTSAVSHEQSASAHNDGGTNANVLAGTGDKDFDTIIGGVAQHFGKSLSEMDAGDRARSYGFLSDLSHLMRENSYDPTLTMISLLEQSNKSPEFNEVASALESLKAKLNVGLAIGKVNSGIDPFAAAACFAGTIDSSKVVVYQPEEKDSSNEQKA